MTALTGGFTMNKTTFEDTESDNIAQRIKSQFAPAYLTLASIIQGVALTTLVVRVESTYPGFNAVAWLLTITTFLVILDIWHEYLMMVLAYVWLPTLLDSIVPFAFVATELFLAHFVYGNVRGWLLAYAGCYLVGIAAWFLQNAQVRKLDEENRSVHNRLASYDRFRGVLVVILAILSLLAWALYDVLRLEQAQLVVALVAFVGCIIFISSSIPFWNQFLDFALGKSVTDQQSKPKRQV
jgi:hypothetical protein